MDDSAQKKPSARASLPPRVSAVKSILTSRRRAPSTPSTPQVLESLNRAARALDGLASDEGILSCYVGALAGLYPGVRFAMRLSARTADPGAIAEATTHGVRTDAAEEVAITEAGLLRGGFVPPFASPSGMTLRRTYRPILRAPTSPDAAHADGLDAPLAIRGKVIGVVVAEIDRGTELPTGVDDALVIAATLASAALESGKLRRESRHLRDYLDKLLEHANIPVLVVGRDRGVRVASGAFSRITGLTRRELEAQDLLQVAGRRDRGRVLSAFVSAIRGLRVPPFELELPKAGGGHARLEFSLVPIVESEGSVAGVIAIGQDRTEVRELEGQVIQAEKLATLGHLAAGIVHEINNPLTSISVCAEHLMRKLPKVGPEPADLKRLERILQSSHRIMSFTRNLLSYARPSKEDARPVAINEVLEEAVGFCDHLIRESAVAVRRGYGEDLPKVNAIPGQLHQVFVNLITNACNAAQDEGGQVRLHTYRGGLDQVCVRIEDNGVGIGEHDMHRIFEPFFSTRRRGKGTGLGLPIVKSILERHRGSIEVESEIGTGTCVRVTLPSFTGKPS